ncbi:organic cation transporter protein [Caerostris extrusa]|uniref:Organic cation transporter protein n=1 Tax=Caerostris extrusa TaxID=172846 RepID=A0AAV4X3J5_CAEEX|nr:organic cation transporter protein [Caerostris extrusa]
MIYLWFVNAFLYYVFSYNTNDLAGDPYLNFFISGFIEFPSYLFVFWGIKKWGRRPILILCMAVGGVACSAIPLVPSDTAWLSTTFAMVGKFCVTGSFGILCLYTTEVFPTSMRNATYGSCSMFARIGSILAPFVRDLGKATHPTVPNVLYAFLALSSSLLTLLLPETKGLDLPDTLQEAAEM